VAEQGSPLQLGERRLGIGEGARPNVLALARAVLEVRDQA